MQACLLVHKPPRQISCGDVEVSPLQAPLDLEVPEAPWDIDGSGPLSRVRQRQRLQGLGVVLAEQLDWHVPMISEVEEDPGCGIAGRRPPTGVQERLRRPRSRFTRESVSAVHEYLFVPAKESRAAPLVLLHGSDGRETDLIPFAERLMPSAAKISIRGAVATPGGFAFFHRFADRRIDEQDLAARVLPLSEFIKAALSEHELARRPVVVGFSNGAIMAAAMLRTGPEVFSGAILLRPLSPFTVGPEQALNGLPVLLVDGAHDDRRNPGDGQLLAETLRQAGADVQHEVLPTGHLIGDLDEQIAVRWMRSNATIKS